MVVPVSAELFARLLVVMQAHHGTDLFTKVGGRFLWLTPGLFVYSCRDGGQTNIFRADVGGVIS